MSTVTPSYEEQEERLREVESLLDAMRTGKVDSVVADRDASRLLVLRDHVLELRKERQLAELRTILETVPTALAIVRPDGEIYVTNWAFCVVTCAGATKWASCDISCPGRCTTLHQWAAGLQARAGFAEELKQHLAESLEGSRQSGPLDATFRTAAGNQRHWSIGVFT